MFQFVSKMSIQKLYVILSNIHIFTGTIFVKLKSVLGRKTAALDQERLYKQTRMRDILTE